MPKRKKKKNLFQFTKRQAAEVAHLYPRCPKSGTDSSGLTFIRAQVLMALSSPFSQDHVKALAGPSNSRHIIPLPAPMRLFAEKEEQLERILDSSSTPPFKSDRHCI
jgi:hypothetical protein